MPQREFVCAVGGEQLDGNTAFYCECYDCNPMHNDWDGPYYCREEMMTCEECGRYYVTNHWPDSECDLDCSQEAQVIQLHSYNYKPDWVFSRLQNESTNIYLGVELEFEYSSFDNREVSDLIEGMSRPHILWKEDGSLIHGAELVTHPASLQYHLEHFGWADLLEEVRQVNMHPASSCGMHIHASKPPEYTALNRLMTMLINYEKELCGISLRAQHNLDRWARWNSHGWETSKQATEDDYTIWLALMRHCRNQGRYRALNTEPTDTVEFRFFAGSDDPKQVMARLALVDHMMQIAHARHKLPDWPQFLKGIDSSLASKLEEDIANNPHDYILSPYNMELGQ